MLSTQGQKVLERIYSSFRQKFIDQYEGCNENDIERAFLEFCNTSRSWSYTKEERDERNEVQELIDQIR